MSGSEDAIFRSTGWGIDTKFRGYGSVVERLVDIEKVPSSNLGIRTKHTEREGIGLSARRCAAGTVCKNTDKSARPDAVFFAVVAPLSRIFVMRCRAELRQ